MHGGDTGTNSNNAGWTFVRSKCDDHEESSMHGGAEPTGTVSSLLFGTQQRSVLLYLLAYGTVSVPLVREGVSESFSRKVESPRGGLRSTWIAYSTVDFIGAPKCT
jgi:hypothetical protein